MVDRTQDKADRSRLGPSSGFGAAAAAEGCEWQAAPCPVPTRWAADVSPKNVLPEYPRPQLRRDEWQNLNGLWDFAVTALDAEVEQFEGRILVPFPIESSLSGVGRTLDAEERLWLRRRFTVPPEWAGRLVRLHFGAVDWEATVWCNGRELGRHQGGFLPFYFDLEPDWLADGDTELLISVWDPTELSSHQFGKQRRRPRAIQYTAVSGIWQTVWLEPLAEAHIDRLGLTPDEDLKGITVCPEGPGATEMWVDLVASSGEDEVARARTRLGEPVRLSIPDARPWSPDDPHLYDLDVRLSDADGEIDSVSSYFGVRWFDVRPGPAGVRSLHLNGEPVFQLGPLDQGYWPDGLYTAATDEALRFDLEVCKRLGFNTVRKHVKVEPLRWYHHCDQLGLIVWQDMPNGGADLISPGFTASQIAYVVFGVAIRDDRLVGRFGRRSPVGREAFRHELEEMVHHLRDITCIGGWVPFNEGWGQFESRSVAAMVKQIDPTRPVDAASGWFDQGGGDLHSRHRYVGPVMPDPDAGRAIGISEFGGIGLRVPGHRWNPRAKFAYRMARSSLQLTEMYLTRIGRLREFIDRGLSQAIYTQITDVEGELNGLLTYDRMIEKLDFDRITALHVQLLSRRSDLTENTEP